MVEYLSLPDTDVNMRAEARRGAQTPHASPAPGAPDVPSPNAGRPRGAQDLQTALHYACTFGGHDHPAIAQVRAAAAAASARTPAAT